MIGITRKNINIEEILNINKEISKEVININEAKIEKI